MSKNHELDDLKRREQAAFQHKQAAWNAFAETRDRASAAHAAMESAWQARDQTLDRAGIRSSERADAKIVTKPDGTTQIYHGGLGKGDGIGHGHTVLNQSGHKTYDRDAFAAHGHQNFTDDPTKSYPGKGQWGELRHGWIENHAVTWCEGLGVNTGQTLICDGHVSREYFDAHHDHYGPDTKYKSGDRIEDITDAMKRPKYYSGPGK